MGGTPNGHLLCKQLVNNTKLKGACIKPLNLKEEN